MLGGGHERMHLVMDMGVCDDTGARNGSHSCRRLGFKAQLLKTCSKHLNAHCYAQFHKHKCSPG